MNPDPRAMCGYSKKKKKKKKKGDAWSHTHFSLKVLQTPSDKLNPAK